MEITFFYQIIYDTPQLTQFIGRIPKFKTHDEARVLFSDGVVWITIPRTFDEMLRLRILCRKTDWLLSSLAQVCSTSVPLFPALEHLYILENGSWDRQDNIEDGQWLELLQPFAAVKDFHIASKFIPLIAPSLQELVGERLTEVLPALDTLFLGEPLPSEPVLECIWKFVAARELAGHPLSVFRWDGRV